MKLLLPFGAIALLTPTSSVIASTYYQPTKWKPCSLTDAYRSYVDPQYLQQPDVDNFECTKVQAPLCHQGICNSNKTIELFVKRKVETTKPTDGTKSQSIWVLNGGPGVPQSNRKLGF